MLKISSKERGEAAEKRELAKLKLIKISKSEMKKLNEIVHNKELVKDKRKIKNTAERINKTFNKESNSTFYCCGSSWPNGIQCFVCNNSCDDIY